MGYFLLSNRSSEPAPIKRPMWTFSPGPGWTSDPVADGGYVYFLYRREPESFSYLYALNWASGKELWKREVELHTANYHRPVLAAGGRVFFIADDTHVHALDAGTGRELWRAEPASSLLAAAGDAVFILDPDQRLTVLDAASGRVRRQTQIHGEKEIRLYVSNGRLFLVAPLLRRSLQVLDARTFLPLWTFQGKEKESSIGAMPAGGFVYVHADRAIHALAGSSGKEVWTRRTGSIPQAVDAGRLYYTYQNTDFKYFVQALDPWTGAPLGTLRIADAWLAPYGALTAGGGQLYVPVHKSHDFFSGFSNSQDSALCAVDGATGHKMWCSPWQYEYLNVAVYKEGLVFITSTGEGNRSSALYGLRGAAKLLSAMNRRVRRSFVVGRLRRRLENFLRTEIPDQIRDCTG